MKYAMSREAIEVSLPLHSSIIFPGSIVELHANPVARSEVGVTDELYPSSDMGFGQFDHLPKVIFGELGHCTGESWQYMSKFRPYVSNRSISLSGD